MSTIIGIIAGLLVGIAALLLLAAIGQSNAANEATVIGIASLAALSVAKILLKEK